MNMEVRLQGRISINSKNTRLLVQFKICHNCLLKNKILLVQVKICRNYLLKYKTFGPIQDMP